MPIYKVGSSMTRMQRTKGLCAPSAERFPRALSRRYRHVAAFLDASTRTFDAHLISRKFRGKALEGLLIACMAVFLPGGIAHADS
eukprot:scaffold616272_cov18-Prasinocladus_malaysianus.AAC.1